MDTPQTLLAGRQFEGATAALAATAVLLACANLQGCAFDVDAPVAHIAAPLSGTDENEIWRGGTPSNTMNLCFQPFDQAALNDPRWTDFTQDMRDLIEEAYEDPPGNGLTLTGWGLCNNWSEFLVGNQPSTTVEILVWHTNTGYAARRRCADDSTIQFPLNCSSGDHVVLAISMDFWALETGILHEFGHVLGLDHEYFRDDWDGACAQAGGTEAGGFRLTEYDPDSIMSGTYCHTRTSLTALDELGVEILFPSSSVRSLSATSSFVMGDGTLIARTNSTVTDEWTRRGAYDGVITVTGWTSDGETVGGSESVPAADLSSGEIAEVVKSFDDFLDRSRTAEGAVITDDSQHAAIAVGLL